MDEYQKRKGREYLISRSILSTKKIKTPSICGIDKEKWYESFNQLHYSYPFHIRITYVKA